MSQCMPFPLLRYLALGRRVMGVLLEPGPGLAAPSLARLGGCVPEYFGKVFGFSTGLLVQLVTIDRRLPVHLFASTHDVAERTVLLRDAPGRYRGGIHLLLNVVPRYVLLWQAHLSHRDKRRERLRPLHGHILDGHLLQVHTQLHLYIKLVRALF